jgi:hypothetical protein
MSAEARIVMAAETTVAGKRDCKHACCWAMAQYSSRHFHNRHARTNTRAVGSGVFCAVRAEAIHITKNGCPFM